MVVPLFHVISLSFILFLIGAIGVFVRRDAITIFLCIEIMLNAANVAFVAFARARGDEFGQIAALIVITVAAAEAAVGLAVIVTLTRTHASARLDEIRELRG